MGNEDAHTRRLGSPCRVSFVVTSRNDDHGGRMLSRFGVFADGLLEQANRHELSGELIVVEWNPPPGPRLHEVLKLRNTSDSFPVRFIEVPAEAHKPIQNSDTISLFQMIAKNVGIRRARGEFVVATNPDVLFSDELISFLATGDLRAGAMYRIDRHDVEADVPEDAGIEEQLAWCAQHVLRIHGRRGTIVPREVGWWKRLARVLSDSIMAAPGRMQHWTRRQSDKILALGQACHYLTITLRNRLGGWRPWHVEQTRRILSRTLPLFWQSCQGIARRQVYRFGPGVVRRAIVRAYVLFGPFGTVRNAIWLGLRKLLGPPRVHTNGCGDFTMLPRDRWSALRGYPELPLWSMHIDSFLCFMAVASGLREEVLGRRCVMFHMEHERSWVVMTPEERLRTFALKPWIDVGLLCDLWEEAYERRRPVIFNSEKWGLAEWNLDEVVLISGERQVITSNSLSVPVGEER